MLRLLLRMLWYLQGGGISASGNVSLIESTVSGNVIYGAFFTYLVNSSGGGIGHTPVR